MRLSLIDSISSIAKYSPIFTAFRKQLGHVEQQAFEAEEDREGFAPIVVMDIYEGFLAALKVSRKGGIVMCICSATMYLGFE
jgi:hypothetical protein